MLAVYLLVIVAVAMSAMSMKQNKKVSNQLTQNNETINNLQVETRSWKKRYEEEKVDHHKTTQFFMKELTNMNKRIDVLEQIVSKMDGRKIVRDEQSNIVAIRKTG